MLRRWQAECVDAAIEKYESGKGSHFLCLATPGAGKTVMAANVASRLFNQGLIDYVLCFSPSLIVAEGMKSTFGWVLDCSFNGSIGAVGGSYTYQGLLYFHEDFWRIFKKYRVLVVFDEIHHCAGTNFLDANAWGLEVLTNIQEHATYTLALTGTPWRSDKTPITLSSYSTPDQKLMVDYSYGLYDAVVDGVCRRPKLVLIDSNDITLKRDNDVKRYTSFKAFFAEESLPYSYLIFQKSAIKYVLRQGCKKLEEIRLQNPNAAGLVVASSVKHANEIHQLLVSELGQTASLVTYRHDDPLNEIRAFRSGKTKWIVSVGMISEGTDIPRLQVCCHLSTVKTELYFRQVLGRILRVNGEPNNEAWLFTLSEERLTDFAHRVIEELPEEYACLPDSNQSLASVITMGSNLWASDAKPCGRERELLLGGVCSIDALKVVSDDVVRNISIKINGFRQQVIDSFEM
ncbi:DEAD/DEAH box helicase family protein [Enterovibrio sp. ZSDZ42]|uniref:DEAD/DEAH box helicase family protein n=1 Tax=Enterovibrio gelatinilyticus TaxID=2899819 RepID=A0ABT5R9T0_9GAMM|nr:DEAD/DEAH box helicase family protein [Enterovibrio sp. ZSDZ42]MDD1796257.1 DEAD/DEAH box helicase family protein [Enterovibrio sp. ZSDZ42]